MNWKERFDKILKEHWIYEEAEDVLYAVHDMIAAVADDMEYSDPDATSTIRRLNDAAWIVFQMSQGIKE